MLERKAMTKLSQRVLSMDESVTLAAGARAKALKEQGKSILNLTLGEPDFTTPKAIQQKAVAAILSGEASYYTASSGLPQLKEAIISYMQTHYGYLVDQKEIVAATGAKFILYAFFMAVLNPDDEVLIPTPYWVSYADQVKMAEGKPVFIPTQDRHQFKVTVEQLEEYYTNKSKVLVLNSPSNPTGMVYTKDELLAIGQWAIQRDVLILADDIYGRLVYNGATFTPISSLSKALRRQTMVVNGVSKTYAMTGWRVGFAVGDAQIIAAMTKIIGQTTSNLTTASQYAAIEALTGSQAIIEEMRLTFESRLNSIYPLLAAVPGFEVIKPQGAFYLFPNVKEAMAMKGYQDVTAFTNAILEETGVALVTGAGFGAAENVRMSYASDLTTLREAVARLNTFMQSSLI